MNRLFLLVMSLSLIVSCVSTPESPPELADEVVDTWAASLMEKDLDALMATYWPDAVVVNLTPDEDASQQTMKGRDEIREMQRGTTDNPDVQLAIRLDTAQCVMVGNTAVYTIEVAAGPVIVTNTLTLEERRNEWRIVHQTLEF